MTVLESPAEMPAVMPPDLQLFPVRPAASLPASLKVSLIALARYLGKKDGPMSGLMGWKSLQQAWHGVTGDLALEQQGFRWRLVRQSRSLVLRTRSLGPERALAILWRRQWPLWLFFLFLMWKAAEPAGSPGKSGMKSQASRAVISFGLVAMTVASVTMSTS
eukprot:2490330-Rhodomonas_salina.2